MFFCRRPLFFLLLLSSAAAPAALAQARLDIALPERTRLLEDQRVDIVVEARNVSGPGEFRVTANGEDITSKFGQPKTVDLDCDSRQDWVYRAEMVSFRSPGFVRVEATLTTAGLSLRSIKDIQVFPFRMPAKRKNVILYIGDGMVEAFRDAGRIVARSVETIPGVPGLREGFFDRLLEMDQMPVAGMIIAHGADKVIADSANTATALATGNKTYDGAINVFADGTDCAWASGATVANSAYWLDNPRVETVPEYLKRRFGYRVGIVTTAAATDATPAAQGSHTGERDSAFEIARQYLENAFVNGPAADVIMGGGREAFDPDVRPDRRDLVAEFEAKGFKLVTNATQLRSVDAATGKLLGLFKRTANATANASGINQNSASHMNVAYDKLGLQRPGSEPLPNFAGFTDQPFLDLMTRKAIEVLSGPDGSQPFYLMVEGASIDKQSHSGHAAGAIWDVIELDKAVGVGRAWAKERKREDTLLICTADHGHPVTIIGVAEVPDREYFDRTVAVRFTISSPVGEHSVSVYRDVHTNVRMNNVYGSSGSGRTGPVADVYRDIYNKLGFPNYIDSDGDGYPENREVNGKGTVRLSVGFRTGSHTGLSLPLTAEGPGAFLFTGYFDQTEVPLKIGAVLGGDTSDADKLLEKILNNPDYPVTPGK